MSKVAWEASSDEGAEIIFAESEEDAENCTDFGFDEIERAEQYDQYAPLGYVPVSVLIKDGWSWDCQECENRIIDGQYCIDENGEEFGVTSIIYDLFLISSHFFTKATLAKTIALLKPSPGLDCKKFCSGC